MKEVFLIKKIEYSSIFYWCGQHLNNGWYSSQENAKEFKTYTEALDYLASLHIPRNTFLQIEKYFVII